MRGDSVRDLYAKTLALLGLGVLAGAGALVDYWPSRVDLPTAGSPWTTSPVPAPIGTDAVRAPEAPVWPSDPVRSQPVATRPTPVADAPRGPRLAGLVPVGVGLVGVGTAVTMAAPPRPAPAGTFAWSAQPDEAPLDDVVAVLVESSAPVDLPQPVSLSARSTPSADSDGLLSSAFRKAGSSIAKGGAVTGSSIASAGASIVDGFAAVSRLFRRALPGD